MRTMRRFGLRNLPGHEAGLNADVRNALVTVQTVPPEPGIIPVAVISVMGIPHDYIPGIKRTSDISVLKLHLARQVNSRKSVIVPAFETPSIDGNGNP